MFNQRGQGSSVFQLLIAAVVALAILGVLMQVLGLINVGVGQEPPKAASDMLKSAVASPATLKTSGTVSFKNGSALNVRAISIDAQTGVRPENLCLSLGDFENDNRGFEDLLGGGQTIKYTGTANQNVKLDVLCDFGQDELEATLESYGLEDKTPNWDCSSATGDQLICVVALRVNR